LASTGPVRPAPGRLSLKQQWATWPGSATAALAHAKAHLAQGSAASELWLTRTLACDPGQPEAPVLLASLLVQAGRSDAGRRVLRRAAAMTPALWSVWMSMATLGWRSEAYREALPFNRRGVILRGPDPAMQMQLGILEALAGSAQNARRLATDVLARDSSQLQAAIDAGVIALSKNRVAAAAILLEGILDRRPEAAEAALVLKHARIAASQAPEDMNEIRRDWRSAGRLHPRDAQRPQPSYLVIRGYGCGFWGEVLNTAINLALADIMGRTPVVYWGGEVRYRHLQQPNAWDLYFEPVSPTTVDDLAPLETTSFPSYWKPSALTTMEHLGTFAQQIGHVSGVTGLVAVNRPETIVVSDGYADMNDVLPWAAPGHRWASARALDVFREIFARLIRPQASLRAELDRQASQLFGSRPHVAVHVRAQSKGKNEEALEGGGVSLPGYFRHVDRVLAGLPGAGVFLLTDLDHAVEAFRQRYGDRIVTLERLRLIQPDEHLPEVSDLGFDKSLDGYRLGLEVLVDAHLAARCERFVGDGASGVSAAITMLKPWGDDHVSLLRRNVFTERGGRIAGPFGKSG